MYFTARIITASIALFIVINGIHGFKPNLLLNLSSIDNSGPLTIGVYHVTFLDNIFPLPFDCNDYIVMDFIYGSKLDLINFVKYVTIKIRENIWNVTSNMVRIKGKICAKTVYEFKIDEVLNEVFNCKLPIRGYKSRLYFVESNEQTSFSVYHNMSISFFKNFIAYWLIFDPKMLLLNNDLNYHNFSKNCNSSSNSYLYVVLGILLSIFIVQFTYWYLNKEELLKILFRRSRNVNQIIMVRPVGTD